jgi:predicted MPP superfamily phosphohydrolase
MKLVAIGDIHGRTIWKDILEKEKPDIAVFMGDYFDSYDIEGREQIENFNNIVKFKEDNPCMEINMLYGNHEHHYMRSYENYSGYQQKNAMSINMVLNFAREKDYLRIAYLLDDLLFTHAGVSTEWLDKFVKYESLDTIAEDINELFHTDIGVFDFVGLSPTGDNVESSPLWIRHNSLLKSNRFKDIKKKYRQVIGHTPTKDLNLGVYKKYLGGRYIPIDTLNTGQYLIYEDKEMSVGKIL